MATQQQRWLWNENENIQIVPYTTANSVYYPRFFGENSENNMMLTEIIADIINRIRQNTEDLEEFRALVESGAIGSGGGGFSGGVNAPHISYSAIAALFNDANNEYDVLESLLIGIDSEGNAITQAGE